MPLKTYRVTIYTHSAKTYTVEVYALDKNHAMEKAMDAVWPTDERRDPDRFFVREVLTD